MDASPAPRAQRLGADLMLALVTLVWGSTFVLVKDAILDVRPLAFLAVRFTLAFLALLPLYGRALARGGRAQLGQGALIGVFLFGGYAFQTAGLQYTTAGKAGFITGLSVVLVPLFSALILRRPPRRDAVLGVALATAGLALLTLRGTLALAAGDLLVLGCAVCFALHIIAVGRSSGRPGTDPGALATLQIGAAGLLAGLCSLLLERRYWLAVGGPAGLPRSAWPALLVTGLLATAGAFLIQNVAQRHTSPTHTALIFSLEPVFAALFAWLWAGETMGPRALAGGMLVLAGMVAAELEPLQRAALARARTRDGATQVPRKLP